MVAGTEEGAPDGVRRRQADEELSVRLRSGKLSLSQVTTQNKHMLIFTHTPAFDLPFHKLTWSKHSVN
jgi:hypothetical protein